MLYLGELTEEGNKYLKYKKLNVDYFISDTKSLFSDNILTENTTLNDISIKFFKFDDKIYGVLVYYDNLSMFYSFNQKPETYQLLNIAYELMPENLILVCDTSSYGYAENLKSSYYSSEKILGLENSYSIEEYGSFTMSFNGNILSEIRSVN